MGGLTLHTWPGSAYPLGATFDGSGTNFAIFSEVAERIELCLFDDDRFEMRKGFGIRKDKFAQFAAVDLPVLIEQPRAESVEHTFIPRRILRNNAMRERVRVDRVRAEMFQHAPYHAFAGGDIASKPDDCFALPLAHDDSSSANRPAGSLRKFISRTINLPDVFLLF